MATVWHGATDNGAATVSPRITNRVVQVLAWIGERRARAQALRELQRMDERDLRDLRISPYDFNEIANGTFRR